MGVSHIYPVISQRTVKLKLNDVRLNKIAKEAAEQCGRGAVPKVHAPLSLEEAMSSVPSRTNLFFDPSGKLLDVKSLKDVRQVSVFIGPEGGFEKSEIAEAIKRGFLTISLGGLIFRAETAAIISSYLVSLY